MEFRGIRGFGGFRVYLEVHGAEGFGVESLGGSRFRVYLEVHG